MVHTPDRNEMLKAYKAYRKQQDMLTWGGWAEGPHYKRYTAEFNRFMLTVEAEARGEEAPEFKPRNPRRSPEMKELLAQKDSLQGAIDSENGMIYTLQQDPYNRKINKRRIAGTRRRITNLKKKIAILDEQMAQLKY